MYQYIIYADVLLALNFFCDFFLLWAAGRILRRSVSLPRICLGALCGALYGLTALYPALNWLTHPFCLFVISLLLLRIAYRWDGPAGFLKLTGVFYLTAFTMAGAALAGERLLEQSGVQLNPMQTLRTGSLLFAVFLAVLLGKRGVSFLRRTIRKDDFRLHLKITAGLRSCEISALLDTGNDLREPLSGLPVVVAEYKALLRIFPTRVAELLNKGADKDPALLLRELAREQNGWGKRFRLVPFSSVGKNDGLLLGFRPDELIISGAGRSRTDQAIVCITFAELGNGYQAVVNPEVLDCGEKYKEASCA